MAVSHFHRSPTCQVVILQKSDCGDSEGVCSRNVIHADRRAHCFPRNELQGRKTRDAQSLSAVAVSLA